MELLTLPHPGAEDFALTTTGRFWSPILLDHLCRSLGTPSHGI